MQQIAPHRFVSRLGLLAVGALALGLAAPASAQRGPRGPVTFTELQLVRYADNSLGLRFQLQRPRRAQRLAQRGAQLRLDIAREGRRARRGRGGDTLLVPITAGGEVAIPRSRRGEITATVRFQGPSNQLEPFSPGPGVGPVEEIRLSSRYVPRVQGQTVVGGPGVHVQPGAVTVQPGRAGPMPAPGTTVRVQPQGQVTVRRGGRGPQVAVTATQPGVQVQPRGPNYGARVIQACDAVFVGSRTQDCIQAAQGYVGDAPALIHACDAFVSSSDELRCIQIGARAQRDIGHLVGVCDEAFVSSSDEMRCVEIVSRSRQANIAATVRACDEAFTGSRDTLGCLERSL